MKTSHALSAVFALVALGLTVGCSGKSSQPGGAETVTKTVTVTETTEPAPTATLTGSAPQIVAVTKLGPASTASSSATSGRSSVRATASR
jgi:hypothetical protein